VKESSITEAQTEWAKQKLDEGYSITEIAKSLYITPKGLSNVMEKRGLYNPTKRRVLPPLKYPGIAGGGF
jgi:DNA-binding NarL/FixJ family response regulator